MSVKYVDEIKDIDIGKISSNKNGLYHFEDILEKYNENKKDIFSWEYDRENFIIARKNIKINPVLVSLIIDIFLIEEKIHPWQTYADFFVKNIESFSINGKIEDGLTKEKILTARVYQIYAAIIREIDCINKIKEALPQANIVKSKEHDIRYDIDFFVENTDMKPRKIFYVSIGHNGESSKKYRNIRKNEKRTFSFKEGIDTEHFYFEDNGNVFADGIHLVDYSSAKFLDFINKLKG